MSSLLVTAVKALTLLPRYTANSVSKPLPTVSTTTVVLPGAVQKYQTEWPPEFPAWFGSPDSLVAFTLVPVTLADPPESPCALAKLSLAGTALPMTTVNRLLNSCATL